MSAVGLTLRQIRFTNKSFWRNPASAFFTFAFPLMFLVIFTALLGSGDAKINGVFINQATYYVVAMASFGVITATYTNIAISVTFQREAGILKRTRGTPAPRLGLPHGARDRTPCSSRSSSSSSRMAFGVAFYSAHVPTGIGLIEFVVTLIVGGLTFCALALALTSIIPNADASPAIVNATIFPLLFLSGIFIPILDSSPEWIKVDRPHLPGEALHGRDASGVPERRHRAHTARHREGVPVPLVGRRRSWRSGASPG